MRVTNYDIVYSMDVHCGFFILNKATDHTHSVSHFNTVDLHWTHVEVIRLKQSNNFKDAPVPIKQNQIILHNGTTALSLLSRSQIALYPRRP